MAAAAAIAGGAVLGGIISSKGAQNAADTQANAAIAQGNAQAAAALETNRQQLALARETRDIQLGLAAPQVAAGNIALAGMMDMAGLSREPFKWSQQNPTQSPLGTLVGYRENGDPIYSQRLNLQGNVMEQSLLRSYGSFEGVRNAQGKLEFPQGPDYVHDVSNGGRMSRPQVNTVLPNEITSGAATGGGVPANLEGLRLLADTPTYNWQADPSYQFRISEGLRAIDNSASSKGLTKSGGTMRALTAYGQDMASLEYQNIFNRLGTLAGYGQVGTTGAQAAVSGTGNMASNAIAASGAAQIGALNSIGAAGAARASGQAASANAWGGALSGIGSALGGYFAGQSPAPTPSPYPINV